MFVPHAAQLAAVMCLALVVSSAYAQTCSYDGSDASVDISSGKGSGKGAMYGKTSPACKTRLSGGEQIVR